jgi:hypothetical protein
MKSAEKAFEKMKQRGEWAEMRFMARAAEHGFRVSKPWGESARYDFALEDNGRFLRIQVKSTVTHSRIGYRCVIQPDKTRTERYTSGQVDFFAAYVIPKDVWYILPADLVLGMSSQIQLSPHRKEHRYARYKEAWHLLQEAVAKKDGASPTELDTSAEGDAILPEPVADPDAEPGEIPLLRGAVEDAPAVGFDPDLVRSRMAGCFERMMKRR